MKNNNRERMADIRHMQGTTWTPLSIPGNKVMENKKKKADSRQKHKAECHKAMLDYRP